MKHQNNQLVRPHISRMTAYRSVRLNQAETECFCSLPLDDRTHLHIPTFMALAMECRQSEGLDFPETTDLWDDIVFYSAMFGLFVETGRIQHPVELVKSRYRKTESDPAFYPVLMATRLPVNVQTGRQGG